ncbi:MAG: extracellular solute-binding protein [Candidatus Saganbacteria bacterium]|nr:extracellular solute-binding protein [Candidatus Saganbacteria bacterium]
MSLSDSEWGVLRREIIPPFEKANNCKIETMQIEAGDLPQMLEAMSSAKRMELDLFAQDNMNLAQLVDRGLVEDLSRYKKDIPKEVQKNLIGVGIFENILYFMPYRPNVQIVYYNKDAFEKYNLKPPKNWDELLAAAKIFKEKEKVGRVLLKACGSGPTVTQLYEFIVSAGGDPFSFNDPGCIKTFEFLQKLWPYVSRDSLKAKWNTSNDYIARESVYLMQNWPFGINIINKKYKKKNIATYSGFAGPAREAHVIGGEVLGIPRGSKNIKLALVFIKYLQSKEVQEKFVRELSWPSIRTDIIVPLHFESVKNALKHGIFRKHVSYWADFDRYMNEAFVRIVIKGEPVKETLNFYAKQMDQVKKR